MDSEFRPFLTLLLLVLLLHRLVVGLLGFLKLLMHPFGLLMQFGVILCQSVILFSQSLQLLLFITSLSDQLLELSPKLPGVSIFSDLATNATRLRRRSTNITVNQQCFRRGGLLDL